MQGMLTCCKWASRDSDPKRKTKQLGALTLWSSEGVCTGGFSLLPKQRKREEEDKEKKKKKKKKKRLKNTVYLFSLMGKWG